MTIMIAVLLLIISVILSDCTGNECIVIQGGLYMAKIIFKEKIVPNMCKYMCTKKHLSGCFLVYF